MILDPAPGPHPPLDGGIQVADFPPSPRRTRAFVLLLAAALLSPLSLAQPSLPRELELGYPAFDQQPGQGWRKIADEGRYLDAAALIERYLVQPRVLEDWQRVNLRFHAAQLYAFAGQNEPALAHLRVALLRDEPPNSPIRWNAYVQATMAFLERDRKKLAELREVIADGPRLLGGVPNLDVVERLLKCFDRPYSVAYRGKSEVCP